MKTVTLYTGLGGYLLFQKGESFLASVEKCGISDYKVIAPINCIEEYPTDDGFECYDVVDLNGVEVER